MIKNNSRKIEFEIRIYDAGEHRLAIGDTPYQPMKIEGEKPTVGFEDFMLSTDRMLKGETVKGSAKAVNLTETFQKLDAVVFMNGKKAMVVNRLNYNPVNRKLSVLILKRLWVNIKSASKTVRFRKSQFSNQKPSIFRKWK